MNKNKVVELLEKVVLAIKEEPEAKKAQAPLNSSRFSLLDDGWILDRRLELEWGPTASKQMNLEEAKKHCASLGARLPEMHELHSLVDYKTYDPAIDKEAFKDTKSGWYWTATPYAPDADFAWCVSFRYGRVDGSREGYTLYVRPVRASQ